MAMRWILVLARAIVGTGAIRLTVDGAQQVAGAASQVDAFMPSKLGLAVAAGGIARAGAFVAPPPAADPTVSPPFGLSHARTRSSRRSQRRAPTALSAWHRGVEEAQEILQTAAVRAAAVRYRAPDTAIVEADHQDKDAKAHTFTKPAKVAPDPILDGLVEIQAMDPLVGKEVPLVVPVEWSQHFKVGSVALLDIGWTEDTFVHSMDYRHRGSNWFGEAEFAEGGARSRVWLKVADTWCPATQRELIVAERLLGDPRDGDPDSRIGGRSGHVVAYYGHKVFGDRTYILMQAADRTLFDLIEANMRYTVIQSKDTAHLHVPLHISLPIIIDVLRGLSDLEAMGVVHGALTPQNVVLLGADVSAPARAVIAGLGGVCSCAGGSDAVDSCARISDDHSAFYTTSPLFQPPQAKDGSPTGRADHAWSAGMILAQMFFSYNPLEEAIFFEHPMASISEFDPNDRRFIREFAAERFAIDNDPLFAALPENLQHLLSGMLEVDPEKRLTTDAALAEAEEIARAHRIPVPAKLASAEPPDAWKAFVETSRLSP